MLSSFIYSFRISLSSSSSISIISLLFGSSSGGDEKSIPELAAASIARSSSLGSGSLWTTSFTPINSSCSVSIPGTSAATSGNAAGVLVSAVMSYSSSLSKTYSSPFLFLKDRPLLHRSFLPKLFTLLMTLSVIGISVNFLRVTFFPVVSDRNL